MEKTFKVSDFYSVALRNRILENQGIFGVCAYLETVLDQMHGLAQDAPTKADREHQFDAIFGRLLSSSVDHELLLDYYNREHADGIHEGSLAENTIRLLQELKVRRSEVPFSG